MDKTKLIIISRYLFVSLILSIFLISIYPGNLIGLLIKGDPTTYPGGDKISHFVAYFILAITGYFSYQSKFKILSIFIFLGIFATAMEILHIIIPNRFYENLDLVMNLAGVCVALIFFLRRPKFFF